MYIVHILWYKVPYSHIVYCLLFPFILFILFPPFLPLSIIHLLLIISVPLFTLKPCIVSLFCLFPSSLNKNKINIIVLLLPLFCSFCVHKKQCIFITSFLFPLLSPIFLLLTATFINNSSFHLFLSTPTICYRTPLSLMAEQLAYLSGLER